MVIVRARDRPNCSSANFSLVVRPSGGQSARSADKSSSLGGFSECEGEPSPVDANTEVCQVGENVCSVPLELCGLTDLNKVLSLDTWNFCLTEEERESLMQFFPTMDAETYRFTMKELFGGATFHFSSPLTDLHKQIKEGDCHPQVVRYRDVLRFLERKEHYQRVRQYQNRMVNRFLKMKRLWQKFPNMSMEEKIDIWNSGKAKKLLCPWNGQRFRTPRVEALFKKRARFVKSKELVRVGNSGSRTITGSWESKRESLGTQHNTTGKKIKKMGMEKHPISSLKGQYVCPVMKEAEIIPGGTEEPITAIRQVKNSLDILPMAALQGKVESKSKAKATPMILKDTYHIGHELFFEDPMERSLDFADDVLPDVTDMDTDVFPLEESNLSITTKGHVDPLSGGNTFYLVEEREMMGIGPDSNDDHLDEPCEKPMKRRKKRTAPLEHGVEPQSSTLDGREPISDRVPQSLRKSTSSCSSATLSSFSFSVIHLLSSVRMALIIEQASVLHLANAITGDAQSSEKLLFSNYQQSSCADNGQAFHHFNGDDKSCGLRAVPLQLIVDWVKKSPGDPRILETQEPLQALVRGALKILSSKATQPAVKGWRSFVAYERETKGWLWIGPLPFSSAGIESREVEVTAEAWGIPSKMLYHIQEMFCGWLKHEQVILQQLGQLCFPPPLTTPIVDEERFRELRAQKSLITINPTSDEMRAYFRREEAIRYSVPERVFFYTSVDGRKLAVAPLRRGGGKPTSKARDHFMLKPNRPPHVTILCLVRDAASRLPGGIGTRADVCILLRDSQYIVEDVSDAQLNQVVSGALDRLHYERDPCVRFDGDRKLWLYLHADKEEEDFEDDATTSTKRWKRVKKDGIENVDIPFMQDNGFSGRGEQDSCSLGVDFSPSSCFAGPSELYLSSEKTELVYTQSGSPASPHIIGSSCAAQGRDDGGLPFIELPPSIQPPCVNMQQSHPMGWEVLGNRWEQLAHSQHRDGVKENYDAVTFTMASHGNIRIP